MISFCQKKNQIKNYISQLSQYCFNGNIWNCMNSDFRVISCLLHIQKNILRLVNSRYKYLQVTRND